MRIPPLDDWRTLLLETNGRSALGEITLMGTIAKSRGIQRNKLRVFGQWAIVYLVAGSGRYRDVRGTETPVAAGDVILVFPEMAHSYGPKPGGVWHEIYVCFRGPIFEAWRETGVFDPRFPVFPWQSPKQGLDVLRPFFSHWKQPCTPMLEGVGKWQEALSHIFASHRSKPEHEHRPAWFLQALDLLERSPVDDEKSLRQIASDCAMGYESFRKKFALMAGQPPGRYALARRIERGQKLLARHRFTNKELAGLLGFSDEFHFCKTFKRLTGTTPHKAKVALR